MSTFGRYRIEVLRSCADILAVRDFWNSCQPHRDADYDFYLFLIGISPQTIRPHVVVLYEGNVPKGLLVCRLDEGRVPVRVGYFSFPVPVMRILQVVHGGWLGDITDTIAQMLVGSIIQSLREGEADVAFMHYADISAPLFRYAKSLPSRLCADHLIDNQTHWARDLTCQKGSGGFLASLSKKDRYQQRKRSRMIGTDFRDSRIEVFQTLREVNRLVRDVETVAIKSYQRGLGVGFFDTPIIRARLEFEARKGWLRAYILYLDGHPGAFWIGSLRSGVFLSDYLGFDAIYAKYAPGMYLIMNVIEELCAHDDAIKRIDFGAGDAPYKQRLANVSSTESPVYIFAPTVKAIAVNALRLFAGSIGRSAKHLLPLRFLGRIKRLWRIHATNNR